MNDRNYALFGLLGPLAALLFIGVSILLSPWFSWGNNALSDLGHSVNSDVAPLFNFGLLLSGFFTILYALTSFRKHAKYTSYFLMLTGLPLRPDGTTNNPNSVGDIYLAATSNPVTLTVQEEPIDQWIEPPYGEEYWTRPLNALNRNWYVLAGN